ncbi:multicopper oxidase family protein [Amycolatopsis silviterrae]|uniref:Multicopper oxidase family protein n=1 Tax=Amycolatopsis silviterrae TaxID=1656914 RepID=A0ABW5HP44_9PSEU
MSGREGFDRRGFLIKAGSAGALALGIGSVAAEAMPRGRGEAVAIDPKALVRPRAQGDRTSPVRPAANGKPAGAPFRGTVTELAPFRDPLPDLARARGDYAGELTVRMRPATVRLHSQLPPTKIWGFDGKFPGPVIEARRGRPLRVTWRNEITGTMPVPVVEILFDENANPYQWDVPGREGVAPRADVAALPGWTSTHLHGHFSDGSSDGWAEDAVLPGHSQLVEYRNDQPATALWYHDHAMHITRWNVMAGLLGMYLVRDDEEQALRLPSGDREIPLVICDRNLDTDARNRLTGTMLHKTTIMSTDPLKQVRSFAGPYTLVNGVIWPYRDVEPDWYRFRMANASNTRPYDVQLVTDDGKPVPPGTIFVIGTDAGLLGAPVDVRDGFSLAASERADVLIDFRALAGRNLKLRNVNYDPGPWPDFLQFRVAQYGRPPVFRLPKTLAKSFRRVAETQPVQAERMIMLTPVGVSHARLWEMKRIDGPPEGKLPIDGIVQVKEADGTVVTWQRMAYQWTDPPQFTVPAGAWERWRFLNLDWSGWPHPMHVHVCAFQPVKRGYYNIDGFKFIDLPGGGIGGGTDTPVFWKEAPPVAPAQAGWKDVVNVDAGESVDVIAKFGDVTGKFVYHCHMLEHEDMSMMRPFLVQPKEVIAIADSMARELPPAPGGGHSH